MRMEPPALQWSVAVGRSALLTVMNAIGAPLPLATWRPAALLRAREWIARRLLGMGPIKLHGIAPSGHLIRMMPRRIYPIARSQARLDGESLGEPIVAAESPVIGGFPLPAQPTFAIGETHNPILDPDEYRAVTAELAGSRRLPAEVTDGVAVEGSR